MEMKEFDSVQMTLGRPFLATTRTIINMDQWEIIIRLGKDYITYKVSEQYCYLRQRVVSKEEANLNAEDQDQDKKHEGHRLLSTS